MMNLQKSLQAGIAIVAASLSLAMFAPAATADTNDGSVVASSRSFPGTNTVRKELLVESTSTDVGGTWQRSDAEKNVNVPQTQSKAEKDAAAKKAAQEAADAAAAEAQAQAASRSEDRSSLTSTSSDDLNNDVAAPNGKSVSALLNYADQFVGKVPYLWGGTTPSGWDCSGFVQYVFAQVGVSLPRSSGAQASVGTAVNGIGNAQPGDIIANSTHVGIYVGSGMVINAMAPGTYTGYSAISAVFSGGYSIRRVL
ncbi:MAG: NlpC/P60 family protein [Bifidobacterium sp.]|jgi:cell wall-associated NlpC family hydrolase|nr:NlpC/P60 family protein [Bifidobacterium sp.]MCI1864840.1 NlpC/P60 family protein [Bifidobacterium sp.]